MILAGDELSGRKVSSSRLERASNEGNGNAKAGRGRGVRRGDRTQWVGAAAVSRS